jgi:hypothetical protein
MHALTKITAHELADERHRLFEESRKDFILTHEAMGEKKAWHDAYVKRDAIAILREIDKVLAGYLESTGMNETAESEAQGRKELE